MRSAIRRDEDKVVLSLEGRSRAMIEQLRGELGRNRDRPPPCSRFRGVQTPPNPRLRYTKRGTLGICQRERTPPEAAHLTPTESRLRDRKEDDTTCLAPRALGVVLCLLDQLR